MNPWLPGPVWADMAAPPTFVIDSLWLGLPVGPIVGLALAAAAVAGFVCLRRRRLHWALAGLICFVLYAAANFGIYMYGLSRAFEERERARNARQRPTFPAVTQPAT